MTDREKVIKGLECHQEPYGCPKCPYWDREMPLKDCENNKLIADALALLREQEAGGWISADKRPPKQGRYLVWGLTRITPDHYDEANGFWEIQPAFWFERSGWDRKVKFWQMLPEPPEEDTP